MQRLASKMVQQNCTIKELQALLHTSTEIKIYDEERDQAESDLREQVAVLKQTLVERELKIKRLRASSSITIDLTTAEGEEDEPNLVLRKDASTGTDYDFGAELQGCKYSNVKLE